MVDVELAFVIGIIGGIIYYSSSEVGTNMKLDLDTKNTAISGK